MTSKFQHVFDGYEPVPSSDEIQSEIRRIFDTHYDKLYTKDNIRLVHSLVDLTSLSSTDSEESIYDFVKQVNDLDESDPTIPPVAAICVYPNFVKTVKECLTTESVAIACVSGSFPSSQTFPEVKVVETGLAIADGADEVDIVLTLGNFLTGNYQEVFDDIHEQRDLCKGQKLKVILEIGALSTPTNIQRASILSLFAGADFIKTSTGKEYPGASFEAAYIMCKVLKEFEKKTGERRGLKVSGGIRTTEDALKYLCIVRELLGQEYVHRDYFRIGASSLVKDIYKHLR